MSRFWNLGGRRVCLLGLVLLPFLPGCESTPENGDDPVGPTPQSAPESAVADDAVVVNRVRYVVGNQAITELDIQRAITELQQSRQPATEAAAVEMLIKRALIEIEAARESIIVTRDRIAHEVSLRKQAMGIVDDGEFQRIVTQETGMPYELWLKTFRYEIIKRQLIQIAVTVPQPTEEEVQRFYNAHRAEVGIEVSFREIIFAPRSNAVQEELRVSNAANEVWRSLRSNPGAFGEVARTTPGNVSLLKPYGGLQPYIGIHELHDRDPIIARQVHALPVGTISSVFRDASGRYVIIKVEGKRPVPYEKVREIIQRRLYFDNEDDAFDRWLQERRRETAIVTVS